jgi:hypothetical protein
VRWRDESARGTARDCDQLARRLSAIAATSSADNSINLGASTAAGARGRSPDYFRCWSQTRWACQRQRADDAWSFLLDRVPDTGRDLVHYSGIDDEDRGCERHSIVDMGDRAVDAPRHGHCGGDLQWSQRP